MRDIYIRFKRALTCILTGIILTTSVMPAHAEPYKGYDYALSDKMNDDLYYGGAVTFDDLYPRLTEDGSMIIPIAKTAQKYNTDTYEYYDTMTADNTNAFRLARALMFTEHNMASKDIVITSVSSYSRYACYAKWNTQGTDLQYNYWNPYYDLVDSSLTGDDKAHAEFDLFVEDLKAYGWDEFNEAIEYVISNNNDEIWADYATDNQNCYRVICPFVTMVINRMIDTNIVTDTGDGYCTINTMNFSGSVPTLTNVEHPDAVAQIDKYATYGGAIGRALNTNGDIYYPEYATDTTSFISTAGNGQDDGIVAGAGLWTSYEDSAPEGGARIVQAHPFGLLNYTNTHNYGYMKNFDKSSSKYFTIVFAVVEPIYIPGETSFISSANLTDLQVGDVLAPNSVIYKGYDPSTDTVWDCYMYSDEGGEYTYASNVDDGCRITYRKNYQTYYLTDYVFTDTQSDEIGEIHSDIVVDSDYTLQTYDFENKKLIYKQGDYQLTLFLGDDNKISSYEWLLNAVEETPYHSDYWYLDDFAYGDSNAFTSYVFPENESDVVSSILDTYENITYTLYEFNNDELKAVYKNGDTTITVSIDGTTRTPLNPAAMDYNPTSTPPIHKVYNGSVDHSVYVGGGASSFGALGGEGPYMILKDLTNDRYIQTYSTQNGDARMTGYVVTQHPSKNPSTLFATRMPVETDIRGYQILSIEEEDDHNITNPYEEWADPIPNVHRLVIKVRALGNGHTVTFNSNGGSAVASQSVSDGATATEPDPAPTKEYQSFEYWYLDDEDTPFDFSTAITDDITLNALWSGEMTYQKKLIQDGTRLSFNWNDSIDDVKTAFTTGNDAGNDVASYEAGYENKNTFWTATMTIQDADYNEAIAGVPEETLPNVSENKNLAVFDISVKKTIAGDEYETDIIKEKDMSHTGSPLSISIDMQSVLPDNAVLSDVSLYRIHNGAISEVDVDYDEDNMLATFENDDYSYFLMYYGWFHEVTFDSKGGSAVASQNVADEGVATKPTPDPTKIGHTFSKWCTDSDATIEYDFTTPITADKTLYAAWTLNQYTVTFVTNGGTAIDPITVNYGQAFEIAPNSTTREGYTLLNWCTDEGLENVYDFTTPVTDNLILYANWNERDYTVHFNSLGGSSVADQTVKYTGKATEPASPTRTGYTFDKWYLYGGDTPLGDGSYELSGPFNFDNAITPYINHMYNTVTLYAGWNKNNYTVSFETNGGNAIASQHIDYLGNATRPADPTKDGHTFSKWYSDIDLTEEFNFSTPIEDNITLYAGYNINQYTVTFDSKGGSAVAPQLINYRSKATIPTDPTMTGNAFDKWYEDEACTQEYDFNTEITDNKTLYAGWQLNKYSVTFVTNGGTAIPSQLKDHGSKADRPENPQKIGHTFAKWCSDEGLTTEYDFDTALEDNLILYADWTLNNYTITFVTNGGTAVDDQHVDHGSYVTRPADPTKEGHTFSKWYTDVDLTTEYDFTASVSDNMTLYAGYDKNSYTVTFNSNGGSGVATQTIFYEEYAEEPADPTYMHHDFVRWYLNDEDTAFDFENTKITDNITLTAKWTLKKYTVTFDSNGGTPVAPQEVEYNTSATRPADPTQDSRNFVRWYLDDPTQAYDFDTPVTEDITLTALWFGEMVYQKRLIKDTSLGFTWDDTMADIKDAFHTDVDDEYADTNNYWTASMTICDVPYEEAVGNHARELPSEEDHKHSVSFDISINKTISSDAEMTDVLEQENLTHTQKPLTVSVDMESVIAGAFGNDATAGNGASNVRISDVSVYRIHNDEVTKLDVEYNRETNKATFENDDYSIFIMYYGWFYEITFDSNGGTAVADQLIHEGNQVVEPTAPTKASYAFDCWCSDIGLTTPYVFSTPVYADMTLYAKWKPLYTVTFDSVGGSAVAPQAVPDGDMATIPTSPTKALYVFDGWYKEASYVTLYDFTDPVTSSFTLYAKWKDAPITHTVTFDSDGGTAYPAQTVADGDKATNPGSPSKSGYTFVAWTMGGSNYDFTAPVTADITLKAVYKKNPEPTPEPEPDPEPSVEVPKFMYTEAKVNGQKFAMAGSSEITIIDVVNYSGYCNPAYDYILEGVLMDKATGKPFIDANGNEVHSVVTFHGSTEGTIQVKFTFNASNVKVGTTLVVFEELRAQDGGLIAQHKDINSEAQSISLLGYVPVQTGVFPWLKSLFD